jgi:hypothetical protein
MKSTLASLFFGIIMAIAGGIVAGGLFAEWWAFAVLVPAGAFSGWAAGGRMSTR